MLKCSHMKKTVPLVVGNWKLNPATQKQAEKLASAVAVLHKKLAVPYVGIAPTALHQTLVGKAIDRSSIMLGAQNVSAFTEGAHTGEQSVKQLKDVGSDFVIIGHSERRAAGETDKEVLAKLNAALAGKLAPIVCVGEGKRDKKGDFFKFVAGQVKSFAKDLTSAEMKKVVIAYEPIWAIGTGKTATADDVKEMQLFILKVLNKLHEEKTAAAVRLLYGGSVKPHNAAELHEIGGMNGFLVGGASLKAKDFIAIVKAVA